MDKTVVGLFSNLAQDKSSPVLIQNEIENNSDDLVHISVKKSAYSLFPRNALTDQTGKGSFIEDIYFKNLACKKHVSFFPNPTSSSFRIEATQPHEVGAVEFYNTTG